MNQRVDQTKFELEKNQWDSYVDKALVFQKCPLHSSLETIPGPGVKESFSSLQRKDPHQKPRSAIRCFTLATVILSLFGIIEYGYDAAKKVAFGYLIFFLSFGSFQEKY